ncbi:argininosuccinate lyase [Halobacteriales archaeon QS_3_64_16]|nr:MAG: argininosuccinate lyase [Halobacteriales archaeon QS_3_64_16]
MSGEDTSGNAVRRDRFSGGPARSFLSSLSADERIFDADLAVDRAHTVMLTEQGIVDAESTKAILAALEEIEAAGFGALPDGEDVHEAIETAVIDRVGPEGGRMHTARSRNDEVATCIRYRLRGDLLEAIEAVCGLREALLASAAEHVSTTMPGYTHLQPAQPTTLAHYLYSYEAAFRRDTERLTEAYGRTNRSPLGAGAFAGTTFDIDRERTAELLGFELLLENSMDAVSTRDFCLESVAILAGLATTLSGLAEDSIGFANRDYLTLADEYASTSSIMPQKKNPDALELVRAAAGEASAGLDGLSTTLKGLPRAYNRDLQEATPHVWRTVDTVTEATDVTAGAIATAEWNGPALADAAAEGFSTATGVADLLASQGVPFRTAHEVVASAAERLGSGELAYREAQRAAIEAAAEDLLDDPLESYVSREALAAVLDPEESVASRDSTGGPAPQAAHEALEDAQEALADDGEALTERREALASAQQTLDKEVSAYL